jgi:hypothetical protein
MIAPGCLVRLDMTPQDIVEHASGLESEPTPAHGFEHSIRVLVPPLGCLLLKQRS